MMPEGLSFLPMNARVYSARPWVWISVGMLLWVLTDRHGIADEVLHTGAVIGRVTLVAGAPDGQEIVVKGRDMSRVVVFLEPIDHELKQTRSERSYAIRQKGAEFRPDFLVIACGESVAFPNNDVIMHNVFSYSRPKLFDLGLYKSGKSKSVLFDTPGVVEIFCSIHRKMYGIIYIAPNQLYVRTDKKGKFEMPHVPVGRYSLRSWHRQLPSGTESIEVTEIHVREMRPVEVEIVIGGERP